MFLCCYSLVLKIFLLLTVPKVTLGRFSRSGTDDGYEVYDLEINQAGIGTIHVECIAEEQFRLTEFDSDCHKSVITNGIYKVRT